MVRGCRSSVMPTGRWRLRVRQFVVTTAGRLGGRVEHEGEGEVRQAELFGGGVVGTKIRVSKPCKSGLMGAMASRRRFVGGAQICRTSKNVPTRSNSRSKSNMRAAASLLVAKPAAARNRSSAATLK